MSRAELVWSALFLLLGHGILADRLGLALVELAALDLWLLPVLVAAWSADDGRNKQHRSDEK